MRFFQIICIIVAVLQAVAGQDLQYTIKTTWDNDTLAPQDQIALTFSAAPAGMRIFISAPLYKDPLPNAPPGRFDGLWDYEVVEAFFLGPNEKYLELEFGPGGHYLAYFLEGVRNVTNPNLVITDYSFEISEDEKSWSGVAVVPAEYFPPGVNAFNAYAIHGQADERKYSALFPVGKNETEGPNFHLLSPFQPIDLTEIIGR